MKTILHPSTFKEGVRVLLLRGRNKDGVEDPRSITYISDGVEQFDRRFQRLIEMARPGERIYGSAGSRDIKKAIRVFKEKQLAAEYDEDPTLFYKKIEARWASSLQSTSAQKEKMWLFDCDTPEDAANVRANLDGVYDRSTPPYWYATKNGMHCVVQPFNRTLLSSDHTRSLIHDNAIVLWGW